MLYKTFCAILMLGVLYYVAGDAMPLGIFIMLSSIPLALFFAPKAEKHVLHRQITQYQSWRERAKNSVPSERLLRIKARARLMFTRREKPQRGSQAISIRKNVRGATRVKPSAKKQVFQNRSS